MAKTILEIIARDRFYSALYLNLTHNDYKTDRVTLLFPRYGALGFYFRSHAQMPPDLGF